MRRFVFLQGPHGPFFREAADRLRRAGHAALRIGFNRGDEAAWADRRSYTAFRGPIGDWAEAVDDALADATDLVLYGDARPFHADAVAAARRRGVTVHCFEEGYLRPFWITYERGGTNGHSRLMRTSVAEMRRALGPGDRDEPPAPARWGALTAHTVLGMGYHASILFRNAGYPNWRPHRELGVARELALHAARLARLPVAVLRHRAAIRRVRLRGVPYHLALLQLGHDAAMRVHSQVGSVGDFVERVARAFAAEAPGHHDLVLKAHPLEDRREPLRRRVAALQRELGLAGRLRFIEGGKLGPLLDRARTVITVNSTAGQQALWRGLPLKAFGEAVYSKPDLVSDQPLGTFLRDPVYPDRDAYRVFRQYLLETSQVPGSFYTAAGRADALRTVIDMMLATHDPYEALAVRRVGARPLAAAG